MSRDEVRIVGNSAAGAFWGLQTFRQLIEEFGIDCLPGCVIEDAPAFAERGFYLDITRGKLPKIDTLKQLIDRLAFCKINMLQFYVEHAFAFKEYEGIVSPEEQLTAQEVRELDDYCYERFIELVPSLSTFGHLYYLLQSDQYRHLCELEGYQPKAPWFIEWMIHHTIDPFNPESIKVIGSLIDQYAPLFRSKRFNICCDETFDLCNGRSKGKDKVRAYEMFLRKIISCVQKHKKHVMMWGDILLKYPQLLEKLPADITVLNWEYNAHPDESKVETIARLGQPQILCPGTSSWDCIVPLLEVSLPNIAIMASYAKKYKALGILNTNWNDYGSIGSLPPAFYPMAVGAAVSWNPDIIINQDFDMAAAFHLYGDRTGESIQLLHRLSSCESGNVWCNLCQWYAGWVQLSFKTEDLKQRISLCGEIYERYKALSESAAVDNAFIKNMMLNCRSIAMLCSMVLTALQPETELPEELEVWLSDFTAAWLVDNEESEVHRVTDFIRLLYKKICLS